MKHLSSLLFLIGFTPAYALQAPRTLGAMAVPHRTPAELVRPQILEFTSGPTAGQIQLVFDQPVNVNSLRVDYLEDTIQISIPNAVTNRERIVPIGTNGSDRPQEARLYQYSSGLVRIRISVPGKGEAYEGRLKVLADGPKSLVLELAALDLSKNVARGKDQDPLVAETATGTQAQTDAETPASLEDGASESAAEEAATPAASGARFELSELVTRGASALGFVFALLGAFVWALRAWRKNSGIGGPLGRSLGVGRRWGTNGRPVDGEDATPIEILNQQTLSPGKSLLVVGVGSQRFLLSLTADRLEMVADLGELRTRRAVNPSVAMDDSYPESRAPHLDQAAIPSARSRIKARLEGLKNL